MKQFSALCICFVLGVSMVFAGTDQWTMFGNMKTPVVYPAIAKLNRSTAVFAGGYIGNVLSNSVSNSAEMLTMQNGQIVHTDLPKMITARAEYPLVVLDSTTIVAVGGLADGGDVTTSIEMFSTVSMTWTAIGDLKIGRRQHVSYQLNDSTLVVVGGRHANLSTMKSAEIVNLRTGASQLIEDFPVEINGAVAGLLKNGTGVICGGRESGPNSPRVPEVRTYDLDIEEWKTVSYLASGREAPQAIKLEDGRLCVVGGSLGESPAMFIGEVMVDNGDELDLLTTAPYGAVYMGLAEHETDMLTIVGGWLSDLTSTDQTAFVDTRTGITWPGPVLNIKRRYTRAVTISDPNTFERYTFAIGGAINGAEITPTIEVLGGCVSAQTSLRPSDIRFRGSAQKLEERILMTDTMTFASGAVWLTSKVSLNSSFETDFGFRLSEGNDHGLVDGGPIGADGVALVFQNVSSGILGLPGQGIGYDDSPHGLAIEFDSYMNAAYSDPGPSHVAVQLGDGQRLHAFHQEPYLKGVATENVPSFLADGTIYHARIRYDNGLLSVWISNTSELGNPVLSVPIDIRTALSLPSNGLTWVGITSATGFSSQIHELMYWRINACESLVSDAEEEEVETNEIRIFPNPAHDVAYLSLSDNIGEATIQVVDINGSVVWTKVSAPATDTSLPVNTLPSGMYMVKVSTSTQTWTQPWSVVR